mgnify:CR=1 FL=1
MDAKQTKGRGSWQHAIRNHAAWYVWLYMAWYTHRNHKLPTNQQIAHAVGCSVWTAWEWRKRLHAEGALTTIDEVEVLFAWPEFEAWINWPTIRAALVEGLTSDSKLLVAANEAV